MSDTPVIRIQALSKVYRLGITEVRALRGIDLEVERGEFVAVMGASGSGKSTLMNILGCLMCRPPVPTTWMGSASTGSTATPCRHPQPQDRLRVQGFNLLSDDRVENVELPHCTTVRSSCRPPTGDRGARAGRAVRPCAPSAERPGGRSGRIARALRPGQLLLADEPTGNLTPAPRWKC